ncbi:S41 family peptidase [Treponema primitia]|uniref:S41 family peptidase n=1 Tax=Treponema primitia TaxID=88058 RepID=UPI0002554F46|nr:S41 family peptidase [Treponema primitia]
MDDIKKKLPYPPAPKTVPAAPKTVPMVWLAAILILSVIFIFASVPRMYAQGNEQDSKKYTSIIQNVFDFIQKRYVEDVDPKILYEGAMSGMFKALGDPYTAFLPESEMSDLNDTTQGNFGGVGLYITKPTAARPDGRPPYVEVASPMEDTPGWRAGINPGDLIVEINDESTDALSMDEVLNRLRGTPGLDVKLLIRRGEKLEFPVTLTRAIIEVPTVKHDMIGNIGYLKLLTFTPMSVDRTREALDDLKSKNYTSFILDLRNNYGGLLTSAVGISDLFLEGGVVVSTKSRISSENQVFTARRGTVVPSNIPVIVLINRGSASASEIVAGALKDRGRAFLVGEKSYGKGSVQQVYPLDKAGFRITTARYYTPSDVNIDKIGIPPDREVLFPEFSDDEAEKLNSLINDNRIPAFVDANPNAGSEAVNAFARELSGEYKIDLSLLRRLIRNEQNRTAIAPVYDLEYDVQLQEAVNILRNGNYGQLMQTTKTLRELQNEAALEDDTALAS